LQHLETSDALPFDREYVPGFGVVQKLENARRWSLAGEYSVTHRPTGRWFRRSCPTCGTRGRCEFARWSDDVLIAKASREWLGR
jgi:hypothetical protein